MATKETSGSDEEPRERGLLVDVLTYPLRRGGLLMLAIGAGFSILLSIGTYSPWLGLFVALFSGGFFASYYLDIVNATVNGSDDLPDWPDVTNFAEDFGRPLLQTLGVTLISSVPFVLVTLLMDDKAAAKPPCLLAALAWAAFYFPMATLGVVMFGHLGGALPHRVLPAIFRALPGYLIVVVLFAGLMVLSALSNAMGERIPLVGFVVTAVPSLYLLMAQGRLIGLLYRSKREEIGWG